MRFIVIALMYYMAAWLVNKFNLNTFDVYTVVYVMFTGAIGAGVSLSQIPSVSKAKNSASKIFSIIEEKSVIDPRSDGVKEIKEGEIEFVNVQFKYPSR